ncbi:MAG TPA: TIGR04282 family arsenosugar biosynthesis glycosyltransferase [Acidobacteriota bacterium]
MKSSSSAERDRVLVIMGREPRPGIVKTRLARKHAVEEVVRIYRCLLQDTLALACSLRGVHVSLMCPAEDVEPLQQWVPSHVQVIGQEGRGLTDGLISVFTFFLGNGFRRVIAFNSDSPHLPASVLESAFALLENHDLVVGPTGDGGYYLLGAKAQHPHLFDPSQMGTESALQALLARAQDCRLSTAFTEEWNDVDTPEDLARFAAEIRRYPDRAPRTAELLSGWSAEDPRSSA